jgi:methylenetetrahydrofolate reductase (NADPH)
VTTVTLGCPKRMEYGPCADLGANGECEVSPDAGGPGRCTLIDKPLVRWSKTPSTTTTPAHPLIKSGRPLVMTELPDFVQEGSEIKRITRELAGHVDAVLFGDANWQRVKFPPSYRAALVQSEGLAAWPGINARDRNRIALEGELLALADLGVAGVHCVTGNHTVSGHRPDAAPVFDLDSTRLTALAAQMGHTVSIAASPHTLPVEGRPIRTADKAAAGASVCMVDQPSTGNELTAFISAVRSNGATALTFMPVITVVLSMEDFYRWSQYPNARIPSRWQEAFREADKKTLNARQVEQLGRQLALQLAEELLAVEHVRGVLFGATADPTRADDVVAAFRDVCSSVRK